MVQDDLKRVGIPVELPGEARVDFHFLRVTNCTLLEEGGSQHQGDHGTGPAFHTIDHDAALCEDMPEADRECRGSPGNSDQLHRKFRT